MLFCDRLRRRRFVLDQLARYATELASCLGQAATTMTTAEYAGDGTAPQATAELCSALGRAGNARDVLDRYLAELSQLDAEAAVAGADPSTWQG